jgi:predicted ferric reductase
VDGAAALALFDPGADLTVFFGVLALTLTAVVLLTILFARLNHEVFVYVHRVIGIAYLVAALHIFGTPGTPLPTPVTLYLALLTVLGLASWLYRSWFSSVLVKRHDFAVAEVKKLDPSVVEIGMEPADGPLSFTPGQFVFVTFYSSKFNAQFHPVSVAQKGEYALITLRPGDARDQFHPFSLTSSPRDRRLRITVKAVGDFTGALHSLDRGAVARVEGPYGRFSYVNVSNRRQVWIAGGIGVTPFLSMARSLEGDTYDIDLYYGYKRREEAFFLEELTAIARASSSLNLVPVPEDEKGFISADMIERTSGALRERDVFICGPPAMIEIITRQLGDKRVPRRQIHFEKFAFGRPRV